jgi:hypothetical protein
MANREYKIGDPVRVIKTGQTAKIIGKGSRALPRTDNTAWTVLPDSGPPSCTVLPEEIEPA